MGTVQRKMNGHSRRPAPRTILCTAVPGIGDAFLATPLLRGLRRAYPEAAIDVLVRRGSEGLVEKQPDIRAVLSLSRRPRLSETVAHIRRIWRRYEMAISTSYADRALMNCWLAAPDRTVVLPRDGMGQWWKKVLVDRYVVHDEDVHVILQNQKLGALMGIEVDSLCVIPQRTLTRPGDIGLPRADGPFVLIQLGGGAAYKSLPIPVWRPLLKYLIDRGQQLVFTGGASESEVEQAAAMCSEFPGRSVSGCGRLTFSQIADLCRQATAYIGVDTATTHLAAATGVFTVGLFGPGNVNRWAPWPCQWRERKNPFTNEPGVQQNGNVVVWKAACTCSAFRNHCQSGLADGVTKCLSTLQLSDLQPFLDPICDPQ